MIILPLHSLYEKDDSKSLRKRKRVVEIANLDPHVNLAIEIDGIGSLWEYDVNLIKNLNYEFNFPFERDVPIDSYQNEYDFSSYEGVKTIQCSSLEDSDQIENYLTLFPSDLDSLRHSECILTTCFSSLIRFSLGRKPEEVMPYHVHEGSSGYDSERGYVICNADKGEKEEKINIETYDCKIIPCALPYLHICVDTISTSYLEELIEIIPDISRLPEYVQKKVERIPNRYKNIPERLECLIGAYKKYWSNFKEDEETSESRKVLNDKIIKYMKNEFNKKDCRYNDVKGEGIPTFLGAKLARSAAEIIEPDFLKVKRGRVKKNISYGVPSKLWVLICLARFFWKNVSRGDIEEHPVGKYIEIVLRRFGEEKPFENESSRIGTMVDQTPINDSYNDYRKFLQEFPEIKYMRDVSFRSDYKHSASIIRPLWAKAKSNGDSRYGENKSKGRESYYFITPVTGSDIDNE